jgi:EKC/KEOPS complex subunit CGI121/TPRKB
LIPYLQISEAIRRYGISDSTTSLFVVEIGGLPSHHDKVNAIVNGTTSPFSRLSGITDWATIKKVYYTRPPLCTHFSSFEQYHKLGGELAIQHIRDPATAHAVIDEIVTSTVAMKNVSQ